MLRRIPLAALMLISASIASADTSAFTIIDDAVLDTKLAQARSTFLARHPYVTRLDTVILVPGSNGTWRRGSYNPEVISYPASCVKLAYLASAMYWCRTNGHPYDYLDASVRPMIVNSDNYATGEVVDAITGAPNYQTSQADATYLAWAAKRRFTEDYLTARGLLENQTVLHKTYPTNSGSGPNGAEQVIFDLEGGNRMQAKVSASLMLEIIKGAIEPGANSYMRGLLTHDRWGDGSEFGFGLPPGTIYQNKLGVAYDTLEDIAYIQLPNGQEFFLAAYSNGFVAPETGNPIPYDASLLGGFAETVIETFALDTGNPPKIKLDDPGATLSGSWSTGTDVAYDYDMFGNTYRYINSVTTTATATATWTLSPPSSGLYEVCVWYPQKTSATTVTFQVNHAGGSSNVAVDQTTKGGRWVRLGDYTLNAGAGTVVLTNKASKKNQTVMADAVKITKWPDTTPTATPTPTPSPSPSPTSSPSPTASATATPSPTPGNTVHVSNIAMSSGVGSGSRYYGIATVTVLNQSGLPVSGATVTGSWTGAVSGSASGSTNASGTVTLQSSQKKNGGTFNFCVTGITASGASYNSSLNVETCDSITAP